MLRRAELDPATQRNIDAWLNGPYDEATQAEVKQLLEKHPQKAIDAFYTTLAFGTGGMRGLMGVGTNRINIYTVRNAVQGLANYLHQQPMPPEGHGVFIGYDSRRNSRLFAEEAAKVLAGNSIRAYLCFEMRPTPFVSFGCRHKHCTAAIMITASHNPPEYNGFKVYWSDGAQVLPPHDEAIMAEVASIQDPSSVKSVDSIEHPLISTVGDAIDKAYLDESCDLQLYPEQNRNHGHALNIAYTNLHGTGITLAPRLFKAWGFPIVTYVEEQMGADPQFTTANPPNPEVPSALALGIETMQRNDCDLLIATDPDADRVGVVVKHEGKPVMLTGNQVACLCLEHILEALSAQGKLPANAACVKTLVTTELFQAICDGYHCRCFNVPVGFKHVSQKIREWEKDPQEYTFIFGAEDSLGYLFGSLTRDKDAVAASGLLCEIALKAKLRGKSLVDSMRDLYAKYGVYCDEVAAVVFEDSKIGKAHMASSMSKLKQSPPRTVGGVDLVAIEQISGAIVWKLYDGSRIVIRSSGTEAKIKIYCSTAAASGHPIEDVMRKGKARAFATGIAQTVQMTLLMCCFLREKYRKIYGTTSMRFDWNYFYEAVRIGGPAGTAHMVEIFAHYVFFRIVMMAGSQQMAVAALVQSFYLLFGFIVDAQSKGVGAIVANLIGARQISMVGKVFRAAILQHSLFAIGLFILIFSQLDSLLSVFFVDEGAAWLEDPLLYGMASQAMLWMCLFFLFDGFCWILIGQLTASCDTKFIFYVSTIVNWIAYVIPVYILVGMARRGADAAWMIIAFYSMINFAIFYWRFATGRWLRHVEEAPMIAAADERP